MNQLTLTSVISSLCTLEGAWPVALQSMKWPRKEVEMDTSYYNVSWKGFKLFVLRFLETCFFIKGSLDDPWTSVTLPQIPAEVLMRSCSTSSQWQSVISLQPMSMDRQSFSLVLDVCKALGRWQQAVKIVKASDKSGSKVSRVDWQPPFLVFHVHKLAWWVISL